MRDQYWQMYTDIKHRFFYYKHFQMMFEKINWMLSGFCTLASLSCIAAWGIWGSHPVLWSLIICTAQVCQALFPKLPYNDLLTSTRLMICSLDNLLIEIDCTWLEINYVRDFSDEEILRFVKEYNCKYSELVSQFFSGAFLPTINRLAKESEKDCNAYFERKYFVSKGVKHNE